LFLLDGVQLVAAPKLTLETNICNELGLWRNWGVLWNVCEDRL